MMKVYNKIFILIFFVVFAAVTTSPIIRSWNEQSRMAATEALVKYHTLNIDQTVFSGTYDKVFVRGHFYSDKPPLPSLIAAIVYFPIYYLGMELGPNLNIAYYLVTLFTVKLLFILGLIAFYRALEFTGINKELRVILTAGLGCGSILLPWSSVFNNHSLAASFLIIGFYFLLKAENHSSKKLFVFGTAFFMAMAGASDIPISIFYVGFFVYVVLNPKLRKSTLYYIFAGIIVYMPTLIIDYFISGSIMPVQINKSYFMYPGSPWLNSADLSGMEINSAGFLFRYLGALMLGPMGFFTYNPLLIMAVSYMFIQRNKQFSQKALTIGICTSIVIFYYAAMTNNFSATSYSVRWFVPLIPILYFFLFPVFSRGKTIELFVFSVLLSLSVIIAFVGLINPWSDIRINPSPFLVNILILARLVGKFLI